MLSRFLNSNSVVMDLGANQGEFLQAIIQRFRCNVIAVEPVKALFEEIPRNPLLQLLPIAVGGKNQSIEINIYGTRCASILGAKSSQEFQTTQTVEMVTLAELRRRTGTNRIDLLKIDIEGAEIDLFDSCSDQELQTVMQITVEFHEFLYPEQAPAVKRIIERLDRIGFWVLPFSLDNTNVLFVNRATGLGAAEVAVLRSFVRYGKGIARRVRRTLTEQGPFKGETARRS